MLHRRSMASLGRLSVDEVAVSYTRPTSSAAGSALRMAPSPFAAAAAPPEALHETSSTSMEPPASPRFDAHSTHHLQQEWTVSSGAAAASEACHAATTAPPSAQLTAAPAGSRAGRLHLARGRLIMAARTTLQGMLAAGQSCLLAVPLTGVAKVAGVGAGVAGFVRMAN